MTGIAIQHSPLYGLQTIDQLAQPQVLGMPADRLIALAVGHKNYRRYQRFTGKKERTLSVPCGDLETVQNRLYGLLDQIEKPAYLHSGVRRRSHVSNAAAHLGDAPVLTIDIQEFYPSITVPQVHRFFQRRMASTAAVADLLTRLCTFRGGLPVGSRMSQHLAYFTAKPMLDDLQRLSQRRGITFTCYIDDLSFSGAAATSAFMRQVKQVVHHHGFQSHNDCCYRADERKTITGVVVKRDRLNVPAPQVEGIRSEMQKIACMGASEDPAALDRLIGHVAAAVSIDRQHRKLLEQLLQMRRTLNSERRPQPSTA